MELVNRVSGWRNWDIPCTCYINTWHAHHDPITFPSHHYCVILCGVLYPPQFPIVTVCSQYYTPILSTYIPPYQVLSHLSHLSLFLVPSYPHPSQLSPSDTCLHRNVVAPRLGAELEELLGSSSVAVSCEGLRPGHVLPCCKPTKRSESAMCKILSNHIPRETVAFPHHKILSRVIVEEMQVSNLSKK